MATAKSTKPALADRLIFGAVATTFVTFLAIVLYFLPPVMKLFLTSPGLHQG